MGFCSHQYGRVSDAVCQLCKGISRTGGDQKEIQIPFGADGLCGFYGQNGIPAGQTADPSDVFIGAAEAGTYGLDMRGEDGEDICLLPCQGLYGLFYFIKGTKGSGYSQTDLFSFQRHDDFPLYIKSSSFYCPSPRTRSTARHRMRAEESGLKRPGSPGQAIRRTST